MAKRKSITQEYVLSILNYNSDTGIFTWKTRPLEHFKNQHGCNIWNSKNSGKIAGSLDKDGYRVIRINGSGWFAHRLAFLYVYGWLPDEVDHMNNNGNKDDNRICNLRAATTSQNQANRKISKKNKAGLKGVFFNKPNRKWTARIMINGKSISLKYYDCPAAAYFAYQIAADIYHGEFARI